MAQSRTLRQQLISVILVSCGAVLLISTGALFAYQYFALRNNAQSKLDTLGAVIAANSTAALAFSNADDGQATLSAVTAEPNIEVAALYDDHGALFAVHPDAFPRKALPSAPPDDGSLLSEGRLIAAYPVAEVDDRRLGTLYMRYNMSAVNAAIGLYAAIVLLVLVVAGGVAYFLSTRMQRQISQPIMALTDFAAAVSQQRDYSVRANKPDGHEVGLLTDAFNHMLERIQSQVGNLDLLHRITRSVAERQTLTSIAHTVIRNLEDNLSIDFGCLCTYEPLEQAVTVIGVGPKSLATARTAGLTEQSRIEVGANGLARAVRGSLVYEADIAGVDFPLPRRLAGAGLRSLVIAPLLVESTVFGVLVVARNQPNSFSSGDCEFLRQLSEHVALAAHQTQLNGALQQAYEELRQSQQTVMRQERLRALGQMASGIAHDINNAISPVSLYTESLLEREPNLSQRARDYLTTIQRAVDDVANTVARMREFYRNREPELVLTTLSLDKLAGQVIDFTRARWSDLPQEQGVVIKLQTDFAPDLPHTMGAEAEIRDALTNLIFNAVDAMPDGGTLTVRTRVAPSNGDSSASAVIIEVSDTGVGMIEETRLHCLEPFFTTKGERGTGLGLAMVYGMAQRHSAELEIDSTLGAGTTVRLIFPVANSVVSHQSFTPGSRLARRLRILIVDDDPLLIKSLRDALEGDGHLVTSADGGQAGIDGFVAATKRGEPFSLVITDLGMPYVDGRKVAATIKGHAPNTPILMLTGWGQRLVADNDVPSHVDRILSKPPRLHELRAAVFDLSASTAEVVLPG